MGTPLRWKTRRLLGSRRANAATNREAAANRPFSGRSSVVSCRDGTRQRFTHVAEPFADTFLLGDVTVAYDRVQPRLAQWPPRAPLRGGASHEAEGRRGARGGGAGRVGPPRHAASPVRAAPDRGVVARIVTGPHDAHRQDPHWPMRYDTGRPSSVIRLRISQPRTTSLPCPAGLRARRPSPMMDL